MQAAVGAVALQTDSDMWVTGEGNNLLLITLDFDHWGVVVRRGGGFGWGGGACSPTRCITP